MFFFFAIVAIQIRYADRINYHHQCYVRRVVFAKFGGESEFR